MNFKEAAKIIFLLKTNMIETKGNFKNKYPNNLKCELCEKTEETTQHLFECEGYTEIRRNIVVKNTTPMEILKENNMAPMAEVLGKIIEKRKTGHYTTCEGTQPVKFVGKDRRTWSISF